MYYVGRTIPHNERLLERLGTHPVEGSEASLPCVVSVNTACNEPRLMDFHLEPQASEPGSLVLWDAEALAADPDYTGLNASPTEVTELAEAYLRERKRIFLSDTPAETAARLAELIRESLQVGR